MHINDGDLALLALGHGGSGDQAHLESCSVCRAEVESLATVNELMAQGGPVPVEAPAYLWPAIEAAIAADAGKPQEEQSSKDGARTVTETAAADARTAEPDVLEPRRAHRATTSSRRKGLYGAGLLGAAAAGAGIMWLGSTVVQEQSEQPTTNVASESPTDGDSAEVPVIASADLAALEDSVEPATAEIVERDGHRVLRMDTASLPEVDDGYLQVWLLEEDVAGMVTVGALTADGEEFILPDGLSTETFNTVDVSVEHYDGNPEHSGESLWRGAITST